MAFPSTQLPVHVWIAPGASPQDAVAGIGGWVEITPDVRVSDGIVINTGRPDEAAVVDASTCTLRLDNTAGKYSPRNPNSTYFGRLSRNTPLRVTVDIVSDTFTRTATDGWGTSTSGHPWSLHGTAANFGVSAGAGTIVMPSAGLYRIAYTSVPFADFEVTATWKCSAPTNTTGGNWAFSLFFRSPDGGTTWWYEAAFEVDDASDEISCVVYDRASGRIIGADNVIPYTTDTDYQVRVRVVGTQVCMRVWAAADPEPTLWDVVANSYSGTGLDDLTSGFVGVGGAVYGGNTDTPFTITVSAVTVAADRFEGYVSEWPPRWSMGGHNPTAPIRADGVLRRLTQGAAPLRSATYRYLANELSPAAYWPLEDDEGTPAAASAVPGGRPMTLAGTPAFGTSDTPDGITQTVAVAASDSLTGQIVAPWADSSFTAVFVVTQDTVTGGTAAGQCSVTLDTPGGSSGCKRWRITADVDAGTATVYRIDSADTVTSVASISSVNWSAAWWTIAVTVQQDGSDVDVGLYLYGTTYSDTGTVAGATMAAPTKAVIHTSGAGSSPCVLIGHLAVYETVQAASTISALISAAYGWNGSHAIDRIHNMCTQEAVACHVAADSTVSTLVGVQRPLSLLELIREAEAADGGMLYERGGGLAYQHRAARYDLPVAATATFDQLGSPPEPVDDDQRLRNRVTLTQVGGGSATAEDTTSTAAVGTYDHTAEVNIYSDGTLPQHAGWRLHLGTVDVMRWPRIHLNLAGEPTLIDQVAGLLVGDRIQVTGPPAELPPDTVDVIVEGWQETLGPYGWDIELACSPHEPWTVGEYDHTNSRYNTTASELDADVTTAGTSLQVATASGPLWTTDAGDVPFDIGVGGERMTVTAVAGGSSPQTFTVTRSVNGVTKAHTAGAAISLWRPVYYAL